MKMIHLFRMAVAISVVLALAAMAKGQCVCQPQPRYATPETRYVLRPQAVPGYRVQGVVWRPAFGFFRRNLWRAQPYCYYNGEGQLSWTQTDREVDQRKILPCYGRRGLSKGQR